MNLNSTINKNTNVGGNAKNIANIENIILLNLVLNKQAKSMKIIPIGIVIHQAKLNR
ncbi:hypothetical protein [Xenorhabdus sp. KK7.4]|uniref:hypothetical protein n=1 Tax=Xenorhabdus sp. KK7.4 TaxID=1851572 RepID=UPI00187BE91E|nr:hypothetical protein [Xenorhabdus sp. KK7.4]